MKKKADEDKKNYDNTDQVVDHGAEGSPIYESKQHPGDRYMKRDDNGKDGQGHGHIWLVL